MKSRAYTEYTYNEGIIKRAQIERTLALFAPAVFLFPLPRCRVKAIVRRNNGKVHKMRLDRVSPLAVATQIAARVLRSRREEVDGRPSYLEKLCGATRFTDARHFITANRRASIVKSR